MVVSLFVSVPITASATADNWTDAGNVADSFAGGDGTSGTPFQIATAGQLAYLAYLAQSDNAATTDVYYALTADIDLSAHYWTPIAYFKGHFDGNNHTISGLTINSTAEYQGLFGRIWEASLSNLRLSGVSIACGSFTGGLAGYAQKFTVSNCLVSGSLSGVGCVGGLVGYFGNEGPNTFTDCGVSAAINCTSDNIGGLFGYFEGSATSVTRCFATGSVSGHFNIGGFVGAADLNEGLLSLTDCYTSATVYASENSAGGMFGKVRNFNVTMTNCYQSGTVTATDTSAIVCDNATGAPTRVMCYNIHYNADNTNKANTTFDTASGGLTVSNMKVASFVTTLNGTSSPAPWAADPGDLNGGFPVLAWQITTPAVPVLTLGAVYRTATDSATVRFVSDTAGTYYYQVTFRGSVPSASDLTGWTLGGAVSANAIVSLSPAGLTQGEKCVHIVVKDALDQVSDVLTAEIPSNYYYYENFEVYPTGTNIFSSALSPIQQINGGTGDADQKVAPSLGGPSGKMLSLSSQTSGASDQVVLLDPEILTDSNAYVFEGDVYPVLGSGFQLRFSFTNGHYEGANEAGVFFNGGKIITATLSGAAKLKNSYTAGQWHHVKLVATPSTGTYAVYVDGQSLNSALPLPAGINRLALSAGNNATTLAYYDNLAFYTVDGIAPTLQSAETSADGTKVTLIFDRAMADPTGQHGQFTVTANENAKTVTAAALKSGENYKIELTLTTPVTTGQTVKAGYTKGTVTALDGTALATFTGENVTNNVPANVAQIGSTGYPTLAAALAAAASTDTIVLLSDIGYSNAIVADAKSVNIDLNGHNLTVSGVAGHALDARNNGVLNILDDDGPGVLTVNSSGVDKHCVHAESGGKVTIKGNLTATMPSGGGSYQDIIGAYADDAGSTITLTGNASGTMAGIYSQDRAVITVSGNVSGSYCGAYSAYYGSVNVTGTVSGSYALRPEYGGIAVVTGNITGGAAGIYTNNIDGWAAPSVTVTGDVTGTGGVAIDAGWAGDIAITGNVTGAVFISGTHLSCPEVIVNGDITVSSGFGVSVYYGGTVTVNGRILGASPYLKLNNLDIAQNAYVIDGDYFKYSNQTVGDPAPFDANTVYVKIPAANTVTIGALSGGAITAHPTTAISGTTINLTITPDPGKQLKAGTLKYNDGSDHAISGTSFVMPAANVTVTAQFENIPASGGGGGGAPTNTGTKINVSTTDGSSSVEGTLTQTNGGTQVVIKNDAFDKVDAADKPVSVDAQLAMVTFDQKAMDTIGAAANSGDVTLTVRTVSGSKLSAAQQALVGSRPVYDFTVAGDGKTISNFNGGHATVSIPYTLTAGENPHAIVIWYLSDSGQLVGMHGHYDAATKTVVFITPHFSSFVIGYNLVTFSDVASGAWYHDAVTFLAARGITTGTTTTTFSPDATLTRGQFTVMLLRAYGIEPDSNAADNFSDAGDTWYTGYLAAAKRLGIANGVGDNMFAPDQAITRQEMFTLLYHALGALGEIPTGTAGKALSEFSDTSGIASWAKDAKTLLVESGMVSGSGGKLSPADTTTRAEMAQVLYNLLAN